MGGIYGTGAAYGAGDIDNSWADINTLYSYDDYTNYHPYVGPDTTLDYGSPKQSFKDADIRDPSKAKTEHYGFWNGLGGTFGFMGNVAKEDWNDRQQLYDYTKGGFPWLGNQIKDFMDIHKQSEWDKNFDNGVKQQCNRSVRTGKAGWEFLKDGASKTMDNGKDKYNELNNDFRAFVLNKLFEKGFENALSGNKWSENKSFYDWTNLFKDTITDKKEKPVENVTDNVTTTINDDNTVTMTKDNGDGTVTVTTTTPEGEIVEKTTKIEQPEDKTNVEETVPTQEETVEQTGPKYLEGEDLSNLATQVIRGNWGNGAERKRRLKEAGYSWEQIQNAVNERMGNKKRYTLNGSV